MVIAEFYDHCAISDYLFYYPSILDLVRTIILYCYKFWFVNNQLVLALKRASAGLKMALLQQLFFFHFVEVPAAEL